MFKSITKYFAIKKLYTLVALSFSTFSAMTQNVGIGTATPSEKLDVNVNLNVKGQVSGGTFAVEGITTQYIGFYDRGGGSLSIGEFFWIS